MKLKDAANSNAKRTDAKQKPAPDVNIKQITNSNDIDVIKAGHRVLGDQRVVPHALAEPGVMQPDPLLLVALHASRPHLLSLDDLLACRCVCKQWRQRLGTAFCHTIRIPRSLWSEPANARFAACISSAATAYQQATDLILDAGGSRPGLQPTLWHPLMLSINPWLQCTSTVGSGQKLSKGSTEHNSKAGKKCIHLHLQAPPSPQRLEALRQVQQLSHVRVLHTTQSLYTRHLTALSGLSQLQSLVLILTHPRLDLRSLAHQRVRRVPLNMDSLSRLHQLTQLELTGRGPTGELLPDTAAAFSSPASLAALSNLRCLAISEAALPGPAVATQWLQPLTALQHLQLVQLDEPGKRQRRGRSAAGTSTCGTASAGAASSAAGLLCSGGFGALAAAAGRSGVATAEQLQALQQQQQQLQGLLPGLQGHLHGQQPYTGRLSSSNATAAPAGGGNANQLVPPGTPSPVRTSSIGSGSDADSATAAADQPSQPALDLRGISTLVSLHLANLAGERLIGLKTPNQLTKLALHLANPCPGAVTGDQLAAVVLQSCQTLVSLELGLGTRFSLSGGVMRSLKRGLKGLKDLTLFEGTQDHLEGLGCWCNLRRLELIEGRCSVPLRGLYELSMRAAMGRTPQVLRYCGHVRHLEELAGRLGSALQELRLDSVTGLGLMSRSATLSSMGSGGSEQLDDSSSSPGSGSPSAGEQQDEPTGTPPLAQLVCLTRLEIHGEKLGVLDGPAALALGGLKQLAVLEIAGQEAWLAPELGVKEQLSFVTSLTKLRQLRLSGVMIGRSRLAGCASTSTAAAWPAGPGDGSSSSSGKGSAVKGSGSTMPQVKGLGNGLASSSSSTSSSKAGTAIAPANTTPPVMAAAAAGVVLDSAAAAARDLIVSISLEELRRWLCQLLPCCRVWLD